MTTAPYGIDTSPCFISDKVPKYLLNIPVFIHQYLIKQTQQWIYTCYQWDFWSTVTIFNSMGNWYFIETFGFLLLLLQVLTCRLYLLPFAFSFFFPSYAIICFSVIPIAALSQEIQHNIFFLTLKFYFFWYPSGYPWEIITC